MDRAATVSQPRMDVVGLARKSLLVVKMVVNGIEKRGAYFTSLDLLWNQLSKSNSLFTLEVRKATVITNVLNAGFVPFAQE